MIKDKEEDQGIKENNAKISQGPGPSNLSQETASQDPVKDESDSDADREEEITRKSKWKHQYSDPLDNLISPLDSGIQARTKSRNLVAYSKFIPSIKPKNIKEAMKDPDWVMPMQEDLHQFERSKLWQVVPKPTDRTIIGTRCLFINKLDKHEIIT